MKVGYTILENNIIVSFNGKRESIDKTSRKGLQVLSAIRNNELDKIPDILVVKTGFENHPNVEVKNSQLFVDGILVESRLHGRVSQFIEDNLPIDPLIKFIRKLNANPSFNSRQQLFKFLEHNGHPITEDGNFIAYRGVTNDFKDIHTKTFDNSIGSVCEMSRSEVDDNPNNTCSSGLHVASYNYAKDFGPQLIEVEVSPQDVVCVPVDYNGTKMRTCTLQACIWSSFSTSACSCA